jgi:hypothetical protein
MAWMGMFMIQAGFPGFSTAFAPRLGDYSTETAGRDTKTIITSDALSAAGDVHLLQVGLVKGLELRNEDRRASTTFSH